MKKITLKLINDERKNKKILSAKASIIVCTGGARDICPGIDFAGCEQFAYDYCKYLDEAGCSAPGTTYDECTYDYESGCRSRDRCGVDEE